MRIESTKTAYSVLFLDQKKNTQKQQIKKVINLAVEKAKEWKCIGSVLYWCKSEASVVLLTEFDEKKHENNIRADERKIIICNMPQENYSVDDVIKIFKVPTDYVLNLKRQLENTVIN